LLGLSSRKSNKSSGSSNSSSSVLFGPKIDFSWKTSGGFFGVNLRKEMGLMSGSKKNAGKSESLVQMYTFFGE
jgi:hypothetical protein